MRGLLIVLEGVNGCGKSTIIDNIATYFANINQSVRLYKFPDRTGKFGKQIDDHLHQKNVFKYKYDLLNAFAANRLALKKNILNDIQNGYIVICDRYIFSGIAYHIPLNASKRVIQLHNSIIGYFDRDMPVPDITYLINGNHLDQRREVSQRYHYSPKTNHRLFEIFKKVIDLNVTHFEILKNEYGKLDTVVLYIINDINIYMDCKLLKTISKNYT